MIPLLAAAGGFVAATLIAIFVVQATVNSGHREIVSDAIATEVAEQINIREANLKRLITQMGHSKLLTNVLNEGLAAQSETEAMLTTIIPDAVRVRIFALNQAKVERDGFPPFSFTSLDMVNRVEAGEPVSPEAINADGRWILSIAVPIKNPAAEEARGTLFVYISMKTFTEGVDVPGQVQIIQAVGSAAAKPIAAFGSAGAADAVTRDLDNPNWQVSFTPSPLMAGSSPGNIIFFVIPGLLALIITAGGIVFASSRTAALIETNLGTLGKQIARVAGGQYDAETTYSLPGFIDQDVKLEKFLDFQARPAVKEAAPEPEAPAAPKAAAPPPEAEMVDIEMIDEDTFEEVEDIVDEDLESEVQEISEEDVEAAMAGSHSIDHIFRAYDIRGVVGEDITPDTSKQIGLAIGSAAEDLGEQTILVAYDGRESSPGLAAALIEGLTESGRDVLNIGAVPTPVLYFATQQGLASSGVMVTGSHNAADYNGFKVVLAGETLADAKIQDLLTRIKETNFTSGEGVATETDILDDYLDAITDDVVVAQPLKVVIDCGNGIAGKIAPEMLDNLGCEAVPLYCDVDGTFPNHHPDPTKPENLEDLMLTVQSQGADLGIALDGDCDRMVAVTAEGEIVWPDRLLMLFAKDVVSRNPGSDVVYDVKCTRHLNSVISGFGGRPIISRSGHSFVKAKLQETDAMLGGELSGHICFRERWNGFDDGLYSAARLLEIVGSQEEGLTQLLQEFPVSVATPEIHVAVDDSTKFALVEQLIATADFEDATITTIDGLRVDFADGWGLVRASNTEPALTFRFEADDSEALEDIKGTFREHLQEVREDLNFD